MKRSLLIICSLWTCVALTACQGNTMNIKEIKPRSAQVDVKKLAEGKPQFVKDTVVAFHREVEKPKTLPKVVEDGMGWDVRHKDLRSFDLRESSDFSQVTYDLATKWPQQLPDGFDPTSILETGKNPGLGIRSLHEQGITGKGVNIAIIDQSLLLDHKEYKGNIQMYETLHSYDESASMHGAAVTSIAIGKTTGVAPEAKVYYIASSFMDVEKGNDNESKTNLSYMANGIERVLELNKALPKDEKIRVISISSGFNNLDKKDEKKVYEAIEKAKKEDVLVITTTMNMNYDVQLLGLYRSATKSGDDVENYSLGSWINHSSLTEYDSIYVPMDSRTVAAVSSNDDYFYGAVGGLSWTCPWLAGMYALCLQVNPNLTPDEFLRLASDTSMKQVREISPTNIVNINIVQPNALIEKVKIMK